MRRSRERRIGQYQIDLDPNKLVGYHVTASDVVNAVKMSNNQVDGSVLDQNAMTFMVRGLGYIRELEEVPIGDDEPILVPHRAERGEDGLTTLRREGRGLG